MAAEFHDRDPIPQELQGFARGGRAVASADADRRLDGHRKWQGLVEGSSHLEWHQIKEHARARGLKAHGHFMGEPGARDAYAARLALLLLATRAHPPDAAILVRDSDGQQERRLGLEQARRERNWPFPVVIGFADPKRESWVLAGFEPLSEAEEASLAQLRQELGSDPRKALRDAKRVLRLLVGDVYHQEQSCWFDCPLEDLIERGHLNGLAEYLEEVRTRLVPLFTRGEARS